jgi:hypothetical protein
MKLCGFQGNQFSQVFEPLVFKGSSLKTVITIIISKKKKQIYSFKNDHFNK